MAYKKSHCDGSPVQFSSLSGLCPTFVTLRRLRQPRKHDLTLPIRVN